MPRPPKFPGLQERFERATTNILSTTSSLKGSELLEAVRSKRHSYKISDEECDELTRNFANYVNRAKQAGLLTAGGPWGGYSLLPVARPVASETLPVRAPEEDAKLAPG